MIPQIFLVWCLGATPGGCTIQGVTPVPTVEQCFYGIEQVLNEAETDGLNNNQARCVTVVEIKPEITNE